MPPGLTAYAIEELRARSGRGERHVDLAVRWLDSSGKELLRVGGVYDRADRQWLDRPPVSCRTIRLTPAQDEAGAFFAGWLRRYIAGDWKDYERAWSAVVYGGRRGGKTWLSAAALSTFAVAVPGARVLAVCPTQDAADEIHAELAQLHDPSWCQLYEDEHRYSFGHGSQIKISGAGLRTVGKQGRIDLALINEGQLCPVKLYQNLRGAVVDTGGLVLVAANPPDSDKGEWLETHVVEIKAKKRPGRAYRIDNTRNPHIDVEALLAMRAELPELEYRREVLGEMGLPPPEAVFYAWGEYNRVPVPDDWIDCTRRVTKSMLKREYGQVVGHDFDKRPYMAASVMRAYCPPTGTIDDAHWWVVDAVVEKADEDQMIDLLLDKGIEPADTVVIADASGAWQDVERTRGSASYDYYRHRGFKIIPPDEKSKKNPPRAERERTVNTLLRSAAGESRLHVLPEIEDVIEAIRRWPRKHGKSDARSKYAHICDSVSYPMWRLYGRKLPRRKKVAAGRPIGSGARPAPRTTSHRSGAGPRAASGGPSGPRTGPRGGR